MLIAGSLPRGAETRLGYGDISGSLVGSESSSLGEGLPFQFSFPQSQSSAVFQCLLVVSQSFAEGTFVCGLPSSIVAEGKYE